MIQFYEYFKTPVYWENLSHWADDINKHCDKHIDAAKKLQSYKDRVKEKKSDSLDQKLVIGMLKKK